MCYTPCKQDGGVRNYMGSEIWEKKPGPAPPRLTTLPRRQWAPPHCRPLQGPAPNTLLCRAQRLGGMHPRKVRMETRMNQRRSLVCLDPWRQKKGARRRREMPRGRRGASTNWVHCCSCAQREGGEEPASPVRIGDSHLPSGPTAPAWAF